MKSFYYPSVSGQTLLELVIAIGVVALILTGLVAAVTSSLRFGQASSLRSRGVKLAQEGIERTRTLRDTTTWVTFVGYSDNGTKRWCLDQNGTFTDGGGSSECPISPGDAFWRSITLTFADPIMTVVSQVSWGEHTTPASVELMTYFSQWK